MGGVQARSPNRVLRLHGRGCDRRLRHPPSSISSTSGAFRRSGSPTWPASPVPFWSPLRRKSATRPPPWSTNFSSSYFICPPVSQRDTAIITAAVSGRAPAGPHLRVDDFCRILHKGWLYEPEARAILRGHP